MHFRHSFVATFVSISCLSSRVTSFLLNSPSKQRLPAVPRLWSTSSTSNVQSNDPYENNLSTLESTTLGRIAPNTQALSHLASQLEEGDLNLLPEYQRKYVWKKDKASRLIVTALCNRFIPSIVVHERKQGEFDVVDGKQRLTALLSFYLAGAKPDLYQKLKTDNRLSGDSMLQKLEEDYESLNGLTYAQLSKNRKRAFKSFQLPVVTISCDANPRDVFCVYEDINSGGEDLSKQQLRRAAFWGEDGQYIKLLDKLAENEDFQQIRDREAFDQKKYTLDEKEQDRELILRAFAFAANGQNFKIPMKIFLNSELERFVTVSSSSLQKELADKEETFKFVMKVCNNVFTDEDGAFRVWSKSKKTGEMEWGNKISVKAWDIFYPVYAELKVTYQKVEMYTKSKADIVAGVKNVFEDKEFEACMAGGMTAKKFETGKTIIRSSLRKALEKNNRGAASIAPRYFNLSKQEKERLHESQDGICPLCNETIDKRHISDGKRVELDHKQPFSKGGASTLDNCQLVHTECNRHKSNKYEDDNTTSRL